MNQTYLGDLLDLKWRGFVQKLVMDLVGELYVLELGERRKQL